MDLKTNGQVRAIVRQPDGGIVFGGNFDWVNGVPRSNLARLQPDGNLDPDWKPSANDLVRALATDANGAIYVGGDFSDVGGMFRWHIAKVSGSGTGAVDGTWNPSANSLVATLAIDGDGAVYAGGAFTNIGGQPRSNIARLSGSGAGAADATWNPSADGIVFSLAIDSGAVYAGGYFTNIGGQPRSHIARLSASGSGAADATWNPTATDNVSALAIDSDGSVYAGGWFTNIGGQSRQYIAKLAGSGAGAADTAWNPTANGFVDALVVGAGGDVYAGGEFTNIGGQPRDRLARLSGGDSGAADAGWDPSADGPVLALALDGDAIHAGGQFAEVGGQARQALVRIDATGAPGASTDAEQAGTVYALAHQPGGGIVVGGMFSRANGVLRRNLLRLNADGTLDPDWDPAPDSFVRALAVAADGAVYAGGQFFSIGGQSRQGIARLSADGTGAADATWNPSANADVYALAVDAAGAVYAGGAFSGIGGQPRSRIAKLSATGVGAADATWDPSANGNVLTLALDGGGALYAGGQFTSIGMQPRNCVAKLSDSGTGAADATWNPAATATVNALALDGSGAVYAGGEFTNIGGQSRKYIAKLSDSGTGAADAAWDPSANSYVYALAADGVDAVFVGGNFSVIGGQVNYFIAKLSSSGAGAADVLWYPSADSRVRALAHDGTGVLYAGGEFRNIGGQARVALAGLPVFERIFHDDFEE